MSEGLALRRLRRGIASMTKKICLLEKSDVLVAFHIKVLVRISFPTIFFNSDNSVFPTSPI